MYHPRYIPIVNDDIISLIVILTYFVTSGSLILFFNFCHQHLQNLQVFEIFLFFLSYLVESKDKAKNGPRTIVVKVSNFKDKRKTLHLANKLKDFSRATMDITEELWERVKELRKDEKLVLRKYDKAFSQISSMKIRLTYLSILYSLNIKLKFSVCVQICPLISKIWNLTHSILKTFLE